MQGMSGDISVMVFKRAVKSDIGEISFDSNMLTVLMELDGKKSLGQIAQKTGLNASELRRVIKKLIDLEIVEAVAATALSIDKEFYDYLNTQLSIAIGPVANLLIEDEMADMGYSPAQFPSNRAAELINLLAREIQREDKRITFQKNMVAKIQEKRY